jgi:small subunit ribosomal protein S16
MGAKKKPFYRVVVADQRKARDGRFIEMIGYYDPTTEPPTVKIDAEKAQKWLGNGAQPTETVTMLFRKTGILENKKVEAVVEAPQMSKKAKKKAEEAAAAAEAPVAEAPAAEAPAVEAEAAPAEEAPAAEEAAPAEEAPAAE